MKTLSVFGVLMAAVLVAAQQPTPAEALRAAPKSFRIADIPEGYRAIAFEGEGGVFGAFGLMGVGMGMGMRDGSSADSRESLFFGLMTCSWVDPDEFQSALEGKLPRVRTLTLDLSAAMRTSSTGSGGVPTPVFYETWVEASKIARWTPRPEITKEALQKAFGTDPQTGERASGPTEALSNIKQVALGALLYATDYDDYYPHADSSAKAANVIMPYVKNQSLFKTSNPAGGRILYNTALSGISSSAIEAPAETLLFWEEFPWSDGRRAVAYADGHAKRLTFEEWERAWATEQKRRATARPRAGSKKG